MRIEFKRHARRFLGQRLMFDPASLDILAMFDSWDDDSPADEISRGYVVRDGVAMIAVSGVLVQNLERYLWNCPWITGYDEVACNYFAALDDESVKAICFCIRSPGGDVAGCFDLVDRLYEARGVKPVWAILNEFAYSAGYAIASVADRIIVPRTGGTGSVGVISMHMGFSRMFKSAGIDVTLIQFGDRKGDGSEFRPLSSEALARFQEDVDTMGEMFVDAVARNRGITASRVRATEAATYLGANGVEIGFADAVMAPDAAFRALLQELG